MQGRIGQRLAFVRQQPVGVLDRHGRIVDQDTDRERKPSTVKGYRWIINAQILPALGAMQLEDLTTEHVERWLAAMGGKTSSRRKALVVLHGIFARAKKVNKLTVNPVSDIEKPPQSRSGDIEVFTPEEVWALVRAAERHKVHVVFGTLEPIDAVSAYDPLQFAATLLPQSHEANVVAQRRGA